MRRSNVNFRLPIRNATRVTALYAPAGQARSLEFLCPKRAGFVATFNGAKNSIRTGSDLLLRWQFCWCTLQCFAADITLTSQTETVECIVTLEERIDQLEARLIAYGIALPLILDALHPDARATIRGAVEAVVVHGLPTELTDLQIQQIQQVLREI